MHKRRSVKENYAVFLIPGIVLFAALIVMPFIANIAFSFTRWTGVGEPSWIGLENYIRLLDDDVFWMSFRNILAMIFSMAVVPTVIGLVLAAVLFDYVGRHVGQRSASAFRAIFYLPQVLPIAIAGIVWGWILHPTTGALNTALRGVGLDDLARNWLGDSSIALISVMFVMIWFQLGYPVVIFMAGLQRVDPSIYEAAELDGANWFQRFRHVTVPQIRPEIYVVVLTSTIYALKVFGPIYVLTRGGPANSTNVPSYFAYQNFFERANVGYGASISTILAVIVIVFAIVFLYAQRRSEAKSGLVSS
ncbi:carbohydrate ABC transporter permease [Microcella sp.]|uniref:carbohydrate ABC transporter permease n=1 Tax=Microcella sp. TaxID=1913979 RepID=UPI00261401C8|nr:sugar ABC transporter permease [Microcella sp.]